MHVFSIEDRIFSELTLVPGINLMAIQYMIDFMNINKDLNVRLVQVMDTGSLIFKLAAKDDLAEGHAYPVFFCSSDRLMNRKITIALDPSAFVGGNATLAGSGKERWIDFLADVANELDQYLWVSGFKKIDKLKNMKRCSESISEEDSRLNFNGRMMAKKNFLQTSQKYYRNKTSVNFKTGASVQNYRSPDNGIPVQHHIDCFSSINEDRSDRKPVCDLEPPDEEIWWGESGGGDLPSIISTGYRNGHQKIEVRNRDSFVLIKRLDENHKLIEQTTTVNNSDGNRTRLTTDGSGMILSTSRRHIFEAGARMETVKVNTVDVRTTEKNGQQGFIALPDLLDSEYKFDQLQGTERSSSDGNPFFIHWNVARPAGNQGSPESSIYGLDDSLLLNALSALHGSQDAACDRTSLGDERMTDAELARLRLWRDADMRGTTKAGELTVASATGRSGCRHRRPGWHRCG